MSALNIYAGKRKSRSIRFRDCGRQTPSIVRDNKFNPMTWMPYLEKENAAVKGNKWDLIIARGSWVAKVMCVYTQYDTGCTTSICTGRIDIVRNSSQNPEE